MESSLSDSVLTSPNLCSLPNEILHEIFAYLAPTPVSVSACHGPKLDSERRNLRLDLRSLTLVCRRFYPIALSLAHAHYISHPYHLRILTLDTQHWSKVKTVVFDYPSYFTADEPFRRHLLVRKVVRRFKYRHIYKHAVSLNTDALYRSVENKSYESNAERAAVLCLTRNVEEVLFRSNDDSYDEVCPRERREDDYDLLALLPIIYAARREPLGKVHLFTHLRYLSIDYQNIPIGDLSCLFKLPSLRHLVLERRDWSTVGHRAGELESAKNMWECPEGASNVQNLEFGQSLFPFEIIGLALASCIALESFTIDVPMGEYRLFYKKLLDALARHRDSLTSLRIHGDDTRMYGNLWSESLARRFRQLSRLVHLEVPFRFLTGYGGRENVPAPTPFPRFSRILPASLASLKFYFWGNSPYDRTTTAFTEIASDCQNLREVNVVDNVKGGEYIERGYTLPMDYVRLHKLFSERDMKFAYVFEHHCLYALKHIEDAREVLLALPDGAELVRHATAIDDAWDGVLSRDALNELLSRAPMAPFRQCNSDLGRHMDFAFEMAR